MAFSWDETEGMTAAEIFASQTFATGWYRWKDDFNQWNVESLTSTVVPLPPTVYLLGISLFGIVFPRLRRKK